MEKATNAVLILFEEDECYVGIVNILSIVADDDAFVRDTWKLGPDFREEVGQGDTSVPPENPLVHVSLGHEVLLSGESNSNCRRKSSKMQA